MDPKMRRETRMFRNLKGLLNMGMDRCEDEISHFRTRYSENCINITIAHNILNKFGRCSQLVLKLKGSLEKMRHMELETNLNQEMIFHEKKHLKLQNNDILEICRNLTTVTAIKSPEAKISYKKKPNPKLTYI